MRTPNGAELDVEDDRPARVSGPVQAVLDGTAVIAAGSAIAAAFGPELVKALIERTQEGRLWFAVLGGVGLALVAAGLVLRRQARRRTRVGVLVVASSPRHSPQTRLSQFGDAKDELGGSTMLLKASVDLPEDRAKVGAQLDRLAETTLFAMSMGKKLYPDSARIDIAPVMPLDAAFRFGARLGYTHTRPTVVHARVEQGRGKVATFARIVLQDSRREVRPLRQAPVESLPGVPGERAALAIDLQGGVGNFPDQVRACCQQEGYARLLMLTNERPLLRPKDVPAVVDQVVAAWRAAELPAAARQSPRGVFLSGPPGIAVALGARLAFHEIGMWTPYSWDRNTHRYVPVLPPVR